MTRSHYILSEKARKSLHFTCKWPMFLSRKLWNASKSPRAGAKMRDDGGADAS